MDCNAKMKKWESRLTLPGILDCSSFLLDNGNIYDKQIRLIEPSAFLSAVLKSNVDLGLTVNMIIIQ
jgi:hypothetical protein